MSKYISNEIFEYINNLTESIVDNYFSITEAIKPSFIAKQYNISWSIGNYENAFDGLIECYRGKFHIYINEARHHSSNRMRFTFSHELGHFFIDNHRNALASGEVPYHSSFTNFASELEVEREADLFASCLLMPRNRVLEEYRAHRTFSFKIIHDLAIKFGTSELATLIRLFQLDVHPLIIVKAQAGEIKHIFKSGDLYYYPKHAKSRIPKDSLMFKYYNENFTPASTTQIWTGDWFDTKTEKVLFEHCLIHEGSKTCWSILWTK